MPERMSREKMNRILGLVENIKAENPDKDVQTMVKVVERCIDIIDDIQEDVLFLEEEVERLRFEEQDRQIESGRRGRGRRNGTPSVII